MKQACPMSLKLLITQSCHLLVFPPNTAIPASYSTEQKYQDHQGSLLNADSQAQLSDMSSKKIPGEWYLEICIFMRSPASSAEHGPIGLTILGAMVWISAFQPFLPQVIVRNMFTFCSYTHIWICRGNRSFIRLYRWCRLHFEFSILFYCFSKADSNSLNWFYDSPVGHTVPLVISLA